MRLAALLLALCLLLSGCASWMEGNYHSVRPHEEQRDEEASGDVAVSSYSGLYRALENMVHNGKTATLLSVANYNQLVVARDMQAAVQEVKTLDPIGAYAVDNIQFEVGTNGGQPAISVTISYRNAVQNIRSVNSMAQAQNVMAEALYNCQPGLVLHVTQYQELDIAQWVDDYMQENPHKVMELPQVTVTYYPETGSKRVLDIRFTYQNSREVLRSMRTQVEVAFAQAPKGPEADHQAVYAWLAERFEAYQTDTSLTPAYMLLVHGVGDASAFATVYGALCRQAGLECSVITGTRSGQPWRWNLVTVGEESYHLDLLASLAEGQFLLNTPEQMTGYVWTPLS